MRTIDWEDDRGRKYKVALPDGAPEEDAEMGIPIGPPDVVDALGLPEPQATRLHNQLYRRGMFTLADVRRRPGNLIGALQKALNIDAQILTQAFIDYEQREPISLNGDGDQEVS